MLSGLAAEAGDYDEAIALQEESLTICRSEEEAAPLLPGMLHNLGYAYERAGDYTRARVAFEESLALEPEGTIGRAISVEALGAILLYEGRHEDARPLLEKAVRVGHEAGLTGTKPSAVVLLAAAAAASGDVRRATPLLAWWEHAVEESGEVPLSHHLEVHDRALAQVRARLGEDELNALWREGQQLTPDELVALALVERA